MFSWLIVNSFRNTERAFVDLSLFLYLIFSEFQTLLFFSGDVLLIHGNRGDVASLLWFLNTF